MFKKLLVGLGMLCCVTAFGQTFTGATFNLAKGSSITLDQGRLTLSGSSSVIVGSALPGFLAPSAINLVPGSTYSIGPGGMPVTFTVSIQYNAKAVPSGISETSLGLWQVIGDEWVRVSGTTVDTINKLVKGTVNGTGTFGILGGTSTPFENKVYYQTFWAGDPTIYRVTIPSATLNARAEPCTSLSGLTGMFPEAMIVSPTRNAIGCGRISTTGGFDLYLTNIDGSNPVLVAGPFVSVNQAAFSADGQYIYFSAIKSPATTYSIYKASVANGTITAVQPGGSTAGPAVSNGVVAFADNQKITIISATNVMKTVTSPSSKPVAEIQVSRDGKFVIWSTTYGEIYTANSDGSNLKAISGVNGWNLRLSPDGTSIAYRTNYEPISVMLLSGKGNPVMLLPDYGNPYPNRLKILGWN